MWISASENRRKNWNFVVKCSRRLHKGKIGYFTSSKGRERVWNVQKWKMHVQSPLSYCFLLLNMEICDFLVMVGEMVQNSQRLCSFTFSAIIVIHRYIYSHWATKFLFKKYIYSHSATKFLFEKYIYSHLTTYLFTNIFTYIYGMYLLTFKGLYSFTFTSKILVEQGAIFIQHFVRTQFALH